MVGDFIEVRDWKQFHTPQDLAVSISIEAAELLEIFQWELRKDLPPEKLEHLKEELADVMIYCLSMANCLDLNVSEIVLEKVEKNERKYPVERVKGSSKKPEEVSE
jgi:NTP pyrophosphatase (non-canonical NTP hydrolase)